MGEPPIRPVCRCGPGVTCSYSAYCDRKPPARVTAAPSLEAPNDWHLATSPPPARRVETVEGCDDDGLLAVLLARKLGDASRRGDRPAYVCWLNALSRLHDEVVRPATLTIHHQEGE